LPDAPGRSRVYTLPAESVTDENAGVPVACRSVTATNTVSPTGMFTPNPGVVKDNDVDPEPVADDAPGTAMTDGET
jgi:hypothetical protein